MALKITNDAQLKEVEAELEKYASKDEDTLTPDETKRLDELANAVYEYEEDLVAGIQHPTTQDYIDSDGIPPDAVQGDG
jgi:hypothetical protein